MQMRRRVCRSKAWGTQRWAERRGDIWAPEAICGDIFTPLLIVSASSRPHLSHAFLTSLLPLGAAGSAAPTNMCVCVWRCVLVCVSDPFNKKTRSDVIIHKDYERWKEEEWCGEGCLRGDWSGKLQLVPLLDAIPLKLCSTLVNTPPPPHPCTSSLTVSSVLSRWSFVVKAATLSICGPRKNRNQRLLQCGKSLMFPVGVWQ